MSSTSILVLCDAGAAGRVLLARKDVDIRWSLTTKEALAVLKSGFDARVVLVREALAVELLNRVAEAKVRCPPVVVLLERDGWARRDAFFTAGATALARESSMERILDAVSELTGVAFSHSPRVPFCSVIDATVAGGEQFLESLDLSPTGISVKGFENPTKGLAADLEFTECDPPLKVSAMVVRTFEIGSDVIAGMCFTGMNDHQRTQINKLVEAAQANITQMLPDPVGFSADFGSGAFTADISQQIGSGEQATAVYADMLQEHFAEQGGLMPTWLQNIADNLTPVEFAAFKGEPGSWPWADVSVRLRIRLAANNLDLNTTNAAADMQRVIEHCCNLTVQAEPAGPIVLEQVTHIRAALLREIYGAAPRPNPVVEQLPIAPPPLRPSSRRAR